MTTKYLFVIYTAHHHTLTDTAPDSAESWAHKFVPLSSAAALHPAPSHRLCPAPQTYPPFVRAIHSKSVPRSHCSPHSAPNPSFHSDHYLNQTTAPWPKRH